MAALTNKEFAEKDAVFREACKLAGLPPTQRQASKYRRGEGLAYDKRQEAVMSLSEAKE